MSGQKDSQRLVYNQKILNDLASGLGINGFSKIKTLRDLAVYKFVKKMNLQSDEALLDVGCNAGELLNKITATYKVKGYGLDISDKTIELARKNNPYGNDYVVGDAENLPYHDGFFDAVVSTDVLEHVPNPKIALSEMTRVLKPQGRLFILCISRRNFLSMRYLMQKFHHPHGWGDLADHQQEFLVDPKILASSDKLTIRSKLFFDSFFMLLTDEFIIRPLLRLFSLTKGSKKHSTSQVLEKVKGGSRMSPPAKFYLGFLEVVYAICLILDLPWRLFGVSDALLVVGTKN